MLKKWEKRLDKVIKYLTVAGKKAMEGAGLPWEGPELKELNRQRCGILIGTAMGGMDTFARAVEALHTSGACALAACDCGERRKERCLLPCC